MSVLGLAIVHSLWLGTLVAAAAGIVGARCRQPGLRHAVELIGLVVMAALFIGDVATGLGAGGEGPPAATMTIAHDILGWAYLVAAGVLAARLALGVRTVSRLRRTASALPAAWVARVRVLIRSLDLRRAEVASSVHIDAPLVVGWWRPLVLLPTAWLTTLECSAVEAILVHELWHVRRRDVLLGYIQAVVEIVLCFHPAAWWLSRRARSSREHSCDDAAAARFGARRYAGALLRAEEARHAFAFAPGLGGGQLRDRIARLLGRERAGARWLPALMAVLLAIGLSAPTRKAPEHLKIPWLPQRVRAWEPQLVEAGVRHGVDPELLAIVALVESEGNPRAVSPVGAAGLLQLMPTTATDVARQRGLPEPSRDGLFDPDVNADFGAYYLAKQLHAFDDAPDPIEVAAAAYNGGPGRVRSWLNGRRRLPRETEHYRKLVSALYRERHDPHSPAFARLAARRGY